MRVRMRVPIPVLIRMRVLMRVLLLARCPPRPPFSLLPVAAFLSDDSQWSFSVQHSSHRPVIKCPDAHDRRQVDSRALRTHHVCGCIQCAHSLPHVGHLLRRRDVCLVHHNHVRERYLLRRLIEVMRRTHRVLELLRKVQAVHDRYN